MTEFSVIGISTPTVAEDASALSNETERYRLLLESEALDFLLLRKPGADIDIIRRYLDRIPEALHHKVIVHSFPALLNEYELCGAHLPGRYNGEIPSLPKGNLIGRSCHSLEEVRKYDSLDCYTYVTLSPIFDSISKEGYGSAFSLDDAELLRTLKEKHSLKVIALGGVEPQKFEALKNAGFDGAALLGFIDADGTELRRRIEILTEIKIRL